VTRLAHAGFFCGIPGGAPREADSTFRSLLGSFTAALGRHYPTNVTLSSYYPTFPLVDWWSVEGYVLLSVVVSTARSGYVRGLLIVAFVGVALYKNPSRKGIELLSSAFVARDS